MAASSGTRQPHPAALLRVAGLYGLSFVLPVSDPTKASEVLWGWQCCFLILWLPLGVPTILFSPWGLLWVVNPLFWVGMRMALKRRWVAARAVGVAALACALAPFYAFGGELTEERVSAGYICWAVSIGLFAIVACKAASPGPFVIEGRGAETDGAAHESSGGRRP